MGQFFLVTNSTFTLLKNNPSRLDEDIFVKLIIWPKSLKALGREIVQDVAKREQRVRISCLEKNTEKKKMKGRKTKRGLAEEGVAWDAQSRLYGPCPREPTAPKVLHRPGTSWPLSSLMA